MREQGSTVIHDHFNGSAHCVQCAGQCRLTGESLQVTRLVRFVMEQQYETGICWSLVDSALEGLLGERFQSFKKRCRPPSEEPSR
jgi:hypothetical protein